MGTLVCTIEMDKNGGLTVTVDNADGKITQTVKMDGTKIELKVKGAEATSTITQTSEQVTIECTGQATSTYTQTADKVSIACNKFEVTAKETVSIQSTQDMTLKSDTKIAGTGQTEIALTGGSTSKLDLAAAGATLEGVKVALSGTAQLSGKAPQVEVKSDAMMSLESTGLCTLKGSLTNVQGNLVNLG